MKKKCNKPVVFHSGRFSAWFKYQVTPSRGQASELPKIGCSAPRQRPPLRHFCKKSGAGSVTLTHDPDMACVAARPLRHFLSRSRKWRTPVIPMAGRRRPGSRMCWRCDARGHSHGRLQANQRHFAFFRGFDPHLLNEIAVKAAFWTEALPDLTPTLALTRLLCCRTAHADELLSSLVL